MPVGPDTARPSAAAAVAVEALESRRLFATVIAGTPGNDYITIDATADFAYVVTINGAATEYPEGTLDFVVQCGDGDDVLVVGPGVPGIYADGGAGNDSLVGGDGPDTILGAAQKDNVYGRGGNDRLNGAGGNDKVIGDNGADRLYGGDGNDYMDGGSSRDRFYPGGGNDTCFGQSGDDVFAAIDKTRDELYGSGGIDSGTADSMDIVGSVEHIAII